MTTSNPQFVLGSRSPRRFELLSHIIPAERIEVLAPRSAEELGFDDVEGWDLIERRIMQICRDKREDVLTQLECLETSNDTLLISADTTIVAKPFSDKPIVLGQPPESDDWMDVVQDWFRRYHFGKTHTAITALSIASLTGKVIERFVKTHVTFRADGDRWLNWYIETGEPRGKAGGYAIQGAASVFIDKVEGSISNVVGLPLEALMDVFGEFGIDVGHIAQ